MFFKIAQAVAIGILGLFAASHRIKAILHFEPIQQTVVITVRVKGVGSSDYFIAVIQAIPVAVFFEGIGQPCIDLIAILQSVVIAVRQGGVGAGALFFKIAQAVAIGILGLFAASHRIKAILHFEPIQQTVIIAVRILRIGAMETFFSIAQPVKIRIRVNNAEYDFSVTPPVIGPGDIGGHVMLGNKTKGAIRGCCCCIQAFSKRK